MFFPQPQGYDDSRLGPEVNMDLQRLTQQISRAAQMMPEHPVYREIRVFADVQIFVQYHVYIEWQKGYLLKVLYRSGEGTPQVRTNLKNLCDRQQACFEHYLGVMCTIGADMWRITKFSTLLESGMDLMCALEQARVPSAARMMINNTNKVIQQGNMAEIAAILAFTGENTIPAMFLRVFRDYVKNDIPLEQVAPLLQPFSSSSQYLVQLIRRASYARDILLDAAQNDIMAARSRHHQWYRLQSVWVH